MQKFPAGFNLEQNNKTVMPAGYNVQRTLESSNIIV